MPASLTCSYSSLVNRLASEVGVFPTSSDAITDGVVDTQQAADILQAIRDGLLAVYNAYEWSFLRPLVTITTHASYSTGTITVDASGNVTGTGTVFPDYSVSAGGRVCISKVGSFTVATYNNGQSLVLHGFPAASAFTAASSFVLSFRNYPLPAGVDSLQGNLTFPPGSYGGSEYLPKMSETEIRKMLAHNSAPGRPRLYCENTLEFDPTVGSTRFVTLYPPPSTEITLTGIGTIRPTMIDSTNQYPLGIEVLSLVIQESCLAAWERNVECKGPMQPDAKHNQMFGQLLQQAVEMDKRKGAPEIIGTMYGGRGGGRDITPARLPVYLDMANFPVGWTG
jgi:hypothetical protein